MKNQKTRIAIISVVALLLVLIGVTYAYWLVTKTQTNSNVISSACLDITLDNESNDISLSSQYPMSDEEGMKLTPYTFTVTNNCNTSVDYQVALEATGDEATSIASSALKVALDNNAKLYSNHGEVDTTINGAYESRSIGYSRLAASGNEGSSATHSLRIWIDENAPISEANKTFQSKISVTIGQGIDSPYAIGTLAYDILVNNGGAGVSEIDATELAERVSPSSAQYVSTSSNYYYGTEYTLNETTGTYTLSGEVVQAKLSECRDGSKTCGKYTLHHTSSTATNATLYEVTDFKTSGDYISVNVIKYTTPFGAAETNPSFNKTQDDLGTSYYFRGAATNNYVQFGSYAAGSTTTVHYENVTFEEETPMYWRIVRINGDGTIRLVYDGTKKVANGTAHSATIGDTTYNGDDYFNVNYGDSDIKVFVDTWYNTHLKTNYGGYIADGIFCNDKEVTKVYYYDENYNTEDENGNPITKETAAYTNTYYAPYDRLVNTKAPSLTCTRPEDRYTKTTELGNGKLTHPVGLLTADEAFLAGGTTVSNQTYYLYSGEDFWTSAPYNYYDDNAGTHVWFVTNYGFVQDNYQGAEISARPVINLRADVEFTGNGSFETPYVIKTN